MMINPNDPKWTAYVLGELDVEGNAAIQELLETSAEARALVEELRMATTMLKEEFAAQSFASLSAAQRATIQATVEPKVRRWTGIRTLRWATGLAAAGLILAVALVPSLLRSRQAAYDATPLLTVQNVPPAAAPAAPPVQQAQQGIRLQRPSLDVGGARQVGAAPQIAQTEIAPEEQKKD